MLSQVDWGCEHVDRAADKRKILNANIAALVGTLSVTVYGLVYLASGNAALVNAALVSFPFCGIYALVPWLNHRGYVQLAAWLICFALVGLIFAIMLVAQGTYLEVHYYFLLLGLIPGMLFSLAQWRTLAFFFVVSIGSFLYAEYITIAPDPAMHALPQWLVAALRGAYKGTTLLTMLFVVLLAEYNASTNETRLETLSATDRLTGIANRLQLERVLEQEFARRGRQNNCFSVILLDIDHFKSVNDTHGHPVGDAVLVAVAEVLKSNVRPYDLVGRWGGEEFLVVCSDTAGDGAIVVAEKLRSALAAYPIAVTGPQTASFGVATDCAGDRIADVVQRADLALYRAKQAGRNRVEVG